MPPSTPPPTSGTTKGSSGRGGTPAPAPKTTPTTSTTHSENSGQGTGVTQAGATKINVNSLAGKTLMFNPPAHHLTKAPRLAPGLAEINSTFFSETSGQGAYNGSTFDPTKMNWGRLGSIYTWDYANNLGVDPQEAADPDYIAAANTLNTWSHRWGCTFHYNPTSLAYSVASNENIAAFNAASDSMNLIVPGTATVSIDLYFNRIYDLAYNKKVKGTIIASDYSGIGVSTEDLQGIMTRGTEYDIEFIYRACNGDPGDALHVDYKTADYGFFMKTPIVLHLGAFQYLGFLNGISVNHILFNSNMVPTFSQVSLQFARMITMGSMGPASDPLQNAAAASAVVGSTTTATSTAAGA